MNILNIPILKKIYELYGLFYQCFKNFPRYDRYVVGESCARAISDLTETVMMASYLSGQEKIPNIKLAGGKINLLKFYFLFSRDSRIIDGATYLKLNNLLEEIGKMLGGWERFMTAKNKTTLIR
jgi:hypothetical protein